MKLDRCACCDESLKDKPFEQVTPKQRICLDCQDVRQTLINEYQAKGIAQPITSVLLCDVRKIVMPGDLANYCITKIPKVEWDFITSEARQRGSIRRVIMDAITEHRKSK